MINNHQDQMYRVLRIIILGVFVFSAVTMWIMRYFKLEEWQGSIGLAGFSALLYLLNSKLIMYFIKRRTPDFASPEEVIANVQKWEITAGLGIVPKWVSLIGFLSISALITAVLCWIIGLLQ